MQINRQTMEKEAKIFLDTLFSLPEIAKIAIKDIVIQSPRDEVNIEKGLDICYHGHRFFMKYGIVTVDNPYVYSVRRT